LRAFSLHAACLNPEMCPFARSSPSDVSRSCCLALKNTSCTTFRRKLCRTVYVRLVISLDAYSLTSARSATSNTTGATAAATCRRIASSFPMPPRSPSRHLPTSLGRNSRQPRGRSQRRALDGRESIEEVTLCGISWGRVGERSRWTTSRLGDHYHYARCCCAFDAGG